MEARQPPANQQYLMYALEPSFFKYLENRRLVFELSSPLFPTEKINLLLLMEVPPYFLY